MLQNDRPRPLERRSYRKRSKWGTPRRKVFQGAPWARSSCCSWVQPLQPSVDGSAHVRNLLRRHGALCRARPRPLADERSRRMAPFSRSSLKDPLSGSVPLPPGMSKNSWRAYPGVSSSSLISLAVSSSIVTPSSSSSLASRSSSVSLATSVFILVTLPRICGMGTVARRACQTERAPESWWAGTRTPHRPANDHLRETIRRIDGSEA